MSTHALATTGAASTGAATKTKIGSTFTMPAGGPWLIHHIWGQVARITSKESEGSGGIFHVDALAGDLTPDPAPGNYPLIGGCVPESANHEISAMGLNLIPVAWEASGKAQIDLSYSNLLASTTAPVVACGIIFGDSKPEPAPLTFCDVVSASFASATEQTIGTITLAEKATRIVGILAALNKGDALTAAEIVMATIRLDSADVKFAPAQFPCAFAYNSSKGTAVGSSAQPRADFIPVDIPVQGGARVDVLATTTQSVTGNADLQVFIAYQ